MIKEFYVQNMDNGEILYIREGDGSNLDFKDEEDGFIDYLIYDAVVPDGIGYTYDPDHSDGAMVLLTEFYQDQFKQPEDVIKYLVKTKFIPDDEWKVIEYKEFYD